MKMRCGTHGVRWRRRRGIPFMAACVCSRTLVVDSMFVVSIVSLLCWALGVASGAALAQSEDSRWGKQILD